MGEGGRERGKERGLEEKEVEKEGRIKCEEEREGG